MFNIDIYQTDLAQRQARGAHNPEVIRSKRIVGNGFLPFYPWSNTKKWHILFYYNELGIIPILYNKYFLKKNIIDYYSN